MSLFTDQNVQVVLFIYLLFILKKELNLYKSSCDVLWMMSDRTEPSAVEPGSPYRDDIE